MRSFSMMIVVSPSSFPASVSITRGQCSAIDVVDVGASAETAAFQATSVVTARASGNRRMADSVWETADVTQFAQRRLSRKFDLLCGARLGWGREIGEKRMSVLFRLRLWSCVFAMLASTSVRGSNFNFSTGMPDGRMALGASSGAMPADDFTIAYQTKISSATIYGLMSLT